MGRVPHQNRHGMPPHAEAWPMSVEGGMTMVVHLQVALENERGPVRVVCASLLHQILSDLGRVDHDRVSSEESSIDNIP